MIVPHERCRTKWWAEKTGRTVPFLADPGFWVSSLYGVACQMRIHTDTSNTPATFVIDKRGIIRWAHIGTGARNWADRPTVETTLAKVQEFSE